MELGYRRYVEATKLVPCFLAALKRVRKLDDKVAGGNCAATRGVLYAAHFDTAVLSSVFEHDVLLYTETAAAHKHGWKQKSALYGHVFYTYVTSSFQKLRTLHSTACENHPLPFKAFLQTEDLQMKPLALSARKLCLSTVNFFCYRPAGQEKNV